VGTMSAVNTAPGFRPSGFAKLSDDAINARTGGRDYYLRFPSSRNNNYMFLKVSAGVLYDDVATGMGYANAPNGQLQIGVSTSLDTESVRLWYPCCGRHPPCVDTYGVALNNVRCTQNNAERWFTDYGGTIKPWWFGEHGKRGFNSGDTDGNHALRLDVTVSLLSTLENPICIPCPISTYKPVISSTESCLPLPPRKQRHLAGILPLRLPRTGLCHEHKSHGVRV
jgi:hypothetical protein